MGEMNRENVETVEEIGPKMPLLDFLRQVTNGETIEYAACMETLQELPNGFVDVWHALK